jgi:hypothetical protein|uniref:Uncharacterized protein n=1 Tax=viral metagenome TaxID=1070528 RepID=A0A6C0BEH4_9ZZZZ
MSQQCLYNAQGQITCNDNVLEKFTDTKVALEKTIEMRRKIKQSLEYDREKKIKELQKLLKPIINCIPVDWRIPRDILERSQIQDDDVDRYRQCIKENEKRSAENEMFMAQHLAKIESSIQAEERKINELRSHLNTL